MGTKTGAPNFLNLLKGKIGIYIYIYPEIIKVLALGISFKFLIIRGLNGIRIYKFVKIYILSMQKNV